MTGEGGLDPSQWDEPGVRQPKKKRKVWPIVVLILAILFVVALAAGSYSPESGPSDGGTGETETPMWRFVASFSGATDKTTDTFAVSGSKFRLTWSAVSDPECMEVWAPSPCPAIVSFFVYPEGESAVYVGFVLETNFNEAGDDTIVFESGSFYLKVVAGNLASWSVTIDEWR
jgi:hypothetical protein